MNFDVVQFLKQEYQSRSQRNPSYSLSAFSRDLGLSPSSLNRVLDRKQGLSRRSAERIVKALELSPKEQSEFLTYVEAHFARSKIHRETALHLLEKGLGKTTLGAETYETICHPRALVLLESCALFSGGARLQDLNERNLGSPEEVSSWLDFFLKTGFLERTLDGRYRRTKKLLKTIEDIPNRYIKRFHEQIMNDAQKALLAQSVQDREITSLILPVNREDFEWIKNETRDFKKKILDRIQNSNSKTDVYFLSLQLFNAQMSEKKESL